RHHDRQPFPVRTPVAQPLPDAAAAVARRDATRVAADAIYQRAPRTAVSAAAVDPVQPVDDVHGRARDCAADQQPPAPAGPAGATGNRGRLAGDFRAGPGAGTGWPALDAGVAGRGHTVAAVRPAGAGAPAALATVAPARPRRPAEPVYRLLLAGARPGHARC